MLRRLVTLSAALLAAVSPTLAGPAEARSISVKQVFTVPTSGAFTVVGHGFGHGHGMSQYGAYGAARKGLTAAQILRFYYPGTTLADTSGSLRVQLTAATASNVTVKAAASMKAHDYGLGKAYKLPANGATQWRLVPVGSRTGIEFLKNGAWKRWSPGGKATFDGAASIQATSNKTALVLPSGATRTYRGWLMSATAPGQTTKRTTVNVVKVDDYVKGVVPAEMPASWSAAAVQSQAVAARTYAVWQRQTPKAPHYDICDTTSCQVYGGVDREVAASSTAVDRTAGRVVTYQGKPAFTQFSASSGGWMSAGSAPYLVAKADPYDDHDANPVHDWSKKVDETTLEKAYPAIGDLRTITVTKREGGAQWGARAEQLTLAGSKGSKVISGDEMRTTLGLRSSWFAFTA